MVEAGISVPRPLFIVYACDALGGALGYGEGTGVVRPKMVSQVTGCAQRIPPDSPNFPWKGEAFILVCHFTSIFSRYLVPDGGGLGAKERRKEMSRRRYIS